VPGACRLKRWSPTLSTRLSTNWFWWLATLDMLASAI
jgi:hypothetical protein